MLPRLTLIPRDAQPEAAWRNQGGSTREVAAEPRGASAGDPFVWRVSIATVARDGPFSRFAGVDRRLWLLQGKGMLLDIRGRRVRLEAPYAEVSFAGEDDVSAHLLGGPTQDLNLMVDRARVRAEAQVHELPTGEVWEVHLAPRSQALVVVLQGTLAARAPGHALVAGSGDALLLEGVGTACRCAIEAQTTATFLAASFAPR